MSVEHHVSRFVVGSQDGNNAAVIRGHRAGAPASRPHGYPAALVGGGKEDQAAIGALGADERQLILRAVAHHE